MITKLAIISFAAAIQSTALASSAVDRNASQAVPAGSNSARSVSVSHANDESVEPLQSVRRKLHRAGIGAVTPPDANAGEDLMKHIALLQSLQLPQPRTAPADAKIIREHSPAEDPHTTPLMQTSAESSKAGGSSKIDFASSLDLPGSSPDVIHAFRAAEALYKSGDHPRAAALYRVELDRMSRRTDSDVRRAAWILYQIANCLRIEDPAQAVVYYDRLLAQYPNSPWTPAADIQRKLITWQNTNRPDLLLEKYARDPNNL